MHGCVDLLVDLQERVEARGSGGLLWSWISTGHWKLGMWMKGLMGQLFVE